MTGGALTGPLAEGPLIGAVPGAGERELLLARSPSVPVPAQRGRCRQIDRGQSDSLLSLPRCWRRPRRCLPS